MTITTFASDRETGNILSGEHLTSNIDFYVLNSLCPLSEEDVSVLPDVGQQNLARTGEIIGMQAQPVMTGLHVITGVDLTAAANKATYGITDSTNAAATVYQLKFSIEHAGAWLAPAVAGLCDSTVAGSLAFTLVQETALCDLPLITAPHKYVMVSVGANSQTAALFYSPIL